jgi:aminobenzoyl-glutamate transport protein
MIIINSKGGIVLEKDTTETKKGFKRFEKFLKLVERGGNKLPHPLIMFTVLALFILVLSFFLSKTDISVTYTAASRSAEDGVQETTVGIVNLLSKENLQSFTTGFVNTYVRFFPVGLVIMMTLGIAVAEQSGLISALMKKLVMGAPDYLVTFIVALVGVCANIASDAGIVFAPAIGGAVFYALGRHPVAGVITGYVGAYGGFSANLLIAGTDVMLAGITESVTTSFGIDIPIHPLINWYVMIVSTLMVALVVTIVTEKVTIPLLGKFDPEDEEMLQSDPSEYDISENERRGLRATGIATLIFFAILALLMIPSNSFFRDEAGVLLPKSPFTDSILFILFSYFIIVGVVYGKVTNKIKSGADVAKYMQNGLIGVSGFLVVCVSASVFIDWFGKSNIATVIAVKGAEVLQGFNVAPIPLILMFVVLNAFTNLFITSGASKWLILAPIFVPMLYMMDVSPAAVQMAYRIGDSTTNIISPVSAYIPVVLGMIAKYKNKNQKVGVGTVLSLTLPYSITLLICWIIFFGIWLILGLPMGPGTPAFI